VSAVVAGKAAASATNAVFVAAQGPTVEARFVVTL